MIQIGQTIPTGIALKKVVDGEISNASSDDFTKGKIVIFAVPGAFTPTCHKQHLPSYVARAKAFKEKGVDQLICLSVNDPFVMQAWGEASGVKGVMLLSDGNGELTKALGLTLDGTGFGLGLRSLRYVMVLKDGVVEKLEVEENPGECKTSHADHVLASL